MENLFWLALVAVLTVAYRIAKEAAKKESERSQKGRYLDEEEL